MRGERQLGLFSATLLIVASMIGTGVFTTSGFLLADLHSRWLVLAAWAVGGFVALLGALCYGALASRIPESGGEYIFLSRTVHPAAGYLAGWASLLVGFSAPLAAAATGFGEYLRPFVGGIDPRWPGTILLLVFTAAHAGHFRLGAIVQNASVIIKLVFLLLFLALGAWKMQVPAAPAAAPANLGAFAVSLLWVSFSYSGWNAAIYMSSEIRDASRTTPRAMLLATSGVTIIYLALNAFIIFSAPASDLVGQVDVAAIAARHLGGQTWQSAITAIVTLALATSVSSLVISGPRVYARMAADGYLPRALIPSGSVPRAAIWFQSVIAIVLLWTTTFKALLTYIGFTLSLSTSATVLGLIKLKWLEGEKLKVHGWPWAPVLFVVFGLFSAIFTILRQPVEAAFGGATLLLGLIAYRLHRLGRSSPAAL